MNQTPTQKKSIPSIYFLNPISNHGQKDAYYRDNHLAWIIQGSSLPDCHAPPAMTTLSYPPGRQTGTPRRANYANI